MFIIFKKKKKKKKDFPFFLYREINLRISCKSQNVHVVLMSNFIEQSD